MLYFVRQGASHEVVKWVFSYFEHKSTLLFWPPHGIIKISFGS